MQFTEGTSRDVFRNIVIRSRMKSPPGRRDYEKMFWPGIEVGLVGWERAHSQGNIVGNESPHGIRYAPKEVNQHFQRLGIERFLQELVLEKASDVELWLTTVTSTHANSLRLKEIQYRVDATRAGQSRSLFEASIEIEDRKIQPRISIQANPRHERHVWMSFVT